jgi:8-oxo-dGTP pyrophosphatase MutT (NUDIX family)
MDVELISARLAEHEAQQLDPAGGRSAAVAMVLREFEQDLQVLFIERARCESDPWSGQMAFPGGMVEPADGTPRDAAEREAAEEVGLDLHAAAYLGRLDDMQGRHAGHRAGIIVSGYVYRIPDAGLVTPNYEVAQAVWVPLARFFETDRYTHVRHPRAPDQKFPGIRIGDAGNQVVWGLTHRFLLSFFDIVQARAGDDRALSAALMSC